MMNSRTEHYVIIIMLKFNLLFLVTLVMFKKKNGKKNQIFDLFYCLNKKIKKLVFCKIKFPQKCLKCPDCEIKFP